MIRHEGRVAGTKASMKFVRTGRGFRRQSRRSLKQTVGRVGSFEGMDLVARHMKRIRKISPKLLDRAAAAAGKKGKWLQEDKFKTAARHKRAAFRRAIGETRYKQLMSRQAARGKNWMP